MADILSSQDNRFASSLDVAAQDLWNRMEKCTITVEKHMLGSMNNCMVRKQNFLHKDVANAMILSLSSMQLHKFHNTCSVKRLAVKSRNILTARVATLITAPNTVGRMD